MRESILEFVFIYIYKVSDKLDGGKKKQTWKIDDSLNLLLNINFATI